MMTQPSRRCKPALSRLRVSEDVAELVCAQFCVAQDLGHQPAAYHGCATVRVAQKRVAALGANDLKGEVLQRSNELSAARGRQSAHSGTVTRWTPTNSRSGSSAVPSTSRQSSIDSRIRSMKSSSDVA